MAAQLNHFDIFHACHDVIVMGYHAAGLSWCGRWYVLRVFGVIINSLRTLPRNEKNVANAKNGRICTFRFRLIFFCRAAARTAQPLTNSLFDTGLAGRDVVGTECIVLYAVCFFGVVAPVFCPVVVPSLRGNCTFRVSKYSSPTHSSNRLLTIHPAPRTRKFHVLIAKEKLYAEHTYNLHNEHKTLVSHSDHECLLFPQVANRLCQTFERATGNLRTVLTRNNYFIVSTMASG